MNDSLDQFHSPEDAPGPQMKPVAKARGSWGVLEMFQLGDRLDHIKDFELGSLFSAAGLLLLGIGGGAGITGGNKGHHTLIVVTLVAGVVCVLARVAIGVEKSEEVRLIKKHFRILLAMLDDETVESMRDLYRDEETPSAGRRFLRFWRQVKGRS